MQLLGRAGLRRVFANHRNGESGMILDLSGEDDNDAENGYGGLCNRRRRRRSKSSKPQLPPVPSEEGKKLMDGGVFGSSEYYGDDLRKRSNKLARKLLSRELCADHIDLARTTSAISQV